MEADPNPHNLDGHAGVELPPIPVADGPDDLAPGTDPDDWDDPA